MSKRKAIIEAAKALFWEKGYEATSPRDIQDYSNAGQGSFYHHFRSKQVLANVVVEEIVRERLIAFENVMQRPLPVLERIQLYLNQRTYVLRGCRVGRMVWDSAVYSEDLRRSMEEYFRHIEQRLTEELEKSQQVGEIRLALAAQYAARTIVTVMQGAYTLSRAYNSEEQFDESVKALEKFLKQILVSPDEGN